MPHCSRATTQRQLPVWQKWMQVSTCPAKDVCRLGEGTSAIAPAVVQARSLRLKPSTPARHLDWALARIERKSRSVSRVVDLASGGCGIVLTECRAGSDKGTAQTSEGWAMTETKPYITTALFSVARPLSSLLLSTVQHQACRGVSWTWAPVYAERACLGGHSSTFVPAPNTFLYDGNIKHPIRISLVMLHAAHTHKCDNLPPVLFPVLSFGYPSSRSFVVPPPDFGQRLCYHVDVSSYTIGGCQSSCRSVSFETQQEARALRRDEVPSVSSSPMRDDSCSATSPGDSDLLYSHLIWLLLTSRFSVLAIPQWCSAVSLALISTASCTEAEARSSTLTHRSPRRSPRRFPPSFERPPNAITQNIPQRSFGPPRTTQPMPTSNTQPWTRWPDLDPSRESANTILAPCHPSQNSPRLARTAPLSRHSTSTGIGSSMTMRQREQ